MRRAVRGLLLVLVLTVAATLTSAPVQGADRCDKRGTRAPDRLMGGWSADRLCGLGGGDLMRGYTHNDLLDGGSGDDRLSGGSGDDRLLGGPGDDTVGNGADFAAERGNDHLEGGDGDDVLEAGQGDDVAVGGNGDDVIRLDFGDDVSGQGGPGVDRIYGETGNDGSKVDGGGLFGGPDDDFVSGGGGDDRLYGDAFPAGPAGNDMLLGGGGQDHLEGGGGDDLMIGGKGGDLLDGGDGNDVLVGNSGADTLLGGPGDDLIWAMDFKPNSTDLIVPGEYSAPGDNQIDCGDGNDMVIVDVQDQDAAISGCEYSVVLRSARSYCSPVARWLVSGPKKANLLDLGVYPPNSNRVLQTASKFPEKPVLPIDETTMKSCAEYSQRFLLDPTEDRRPNVRGTDLADVLSPIYPGATAAQADGTFAPDASPDGASIFNAGDGDDTVTGSEGADTVLGGPGDDTIRALGGDDASVEGEAGDDEIFGGDGDDLLFGRTGNDLLRGEAGNDYLEGGRGDDGLSGGAGDDSLFGGFGKDRLKGGDGDDRLFSYDGERDIVDCGPGYDVAEVDKRDTVRGCEKLITPPVKKKPGTSKRR